MALGGGVWTTQNKILPGSYINFASAARATAALSERGTVAIPLALNWGMMGQVFTVESSDFKKNCLTVFGYNYDAEEMLPLRELFQNAAKLHIYRLAGADAAKASNSIATAKYAGTRGNDIKIAVTENADNPEKYDVITYLGTSIVDTQTVAVASELTDNDFVTFSDEALVLTAGTPLSGGTNGTTIGEEVYQTALDAFESYSFNVLGCPSDAAEVIQLFVAYTKRLRDEIGAKFQTVVYKTAADYEGVISVENAVVNPAASVGVYGLVYWLAGAEAGCEVNKTITNKVYDGELTMDVNYTQANLAEAITAGKCILHNVNGGVRVLEDVNTLTTFTDTKGEVFKSNQTMRVIDQIANDTAVLFHTKYMGIIPNDASGRISLWNDVCKLHQELEKLRAIEGFSTDSVTVEQGETKKSVVCTVKELNIINAMSQLYMSVVIA